MSTSSRKRVRRFWPMIRTTLGPGIEAAYQMRFAGMALWTFGAAVIFSYYQIDSFRHWLDGIGIWKAESGFLFAAISTSIFGGALPSILGWLQARRRGNRTRAHLISNTLFWAIKGVEVDLFYIMQAKLFGESIGPGTVAIKTLVDQFIYVPLLGLLTVVLFYLLRDCRYNWGLFRMRLKDRWVRDQYLPVLVSNWLLWIPAIVVIYCVPLALQIPVQNLILCFWVLVLTLMTRQPAQENLAHSPETEPDDHRVSK